MEETTFLVRERTGRWETVNTDVRLQAESRLELALATLNVHVHFCNVSLQQQHASAVSGQHTCFMTEDV